MLVVEPPKVRTRPARYSPELWALMLAAAADQRRTDRPKPRPMTRLAIEYRNRGMRRFYRPTPA